MLNILLGTDWVCNRNYILNRIKEDVSHENAGRVLIVPELVSHDTERRLCAVAGDTSSRYAEVLTFPRLVRRVCDETAHTVPECLDDGGRIIAMASALHQIQSRLKAYASVGTKPEFMSSLLDMIDEFKRCCITVDDLAESARNTEGVLAQKLEELALIYESYDAVCNHGKCDPRDQMAWLLDELETCEYAQNRVFYVDGFPDFTRQHMAILAHLICHSECVTVSLNCDILNSSNLAFEKTSNTAGELLAIAKRYGIPVKIDTIKADNSSLHNLCLHLFQGSPVDAGNVLSLYRTESMYQECMEMTQRVTELVQNGCRYRQIGVVCADFPTYRNVLHAALQRCGIPVYISGTENILDKSVIATVVAAIDTAMSGFDQKDVLRFLKTSLSPLDMNICDRIENYVVLWGIDGNKWIQPWKNHPDGLGEVWNESTQARLDELNSARETALTPLWRLREGLLAARNVAQQVETLYTFFEDIRLSQQLSDFSDLLEARGDTRNAQILDQLWQILVEALEQMHSVLGHTAWDAEVFGRLFKLLLSQYSVGTIPASLDCVTVGPVSAMRCHEVQHLFVLGAKEGALPGYSSSSGVLTSQERTALRTIGLPLTGGAIEGVQAEFSEIFGVFCGARSHITVSCTSEQPSFVYQRLSQMNCVEMSVKQVLGAALTDKMEAAALLARNDTASAAEYLGITAQYEQIIRQKQYDMGFVSPENIRSLYGNKLRLSASQVDKYADCRLSYFLRYGLGIKERKTAQIDPAEFGTYVHAVLEKTVSEVMDKGGFKVVSAEETTEIAQKHSDNYAKARFSELDTERMTYLFKRNSHELAMIVSEVWAELHASEFEPKFFELQFDNGSPMPPIEIAGKHYSAQLRGFVDRVDVWNDGDDTFVRVVDYKTGAKDFDYCDVFNGLGLQMLLYLFALEENGHDLLNNAPVPAGVQYFPARAPMVSAEGLLDDAAANSARNAIWKRKGLILNNPAVLTAMEPYEKPLRMSYSRKKDGSISGDIASQNQFQILKKYIYALLGKMADEIASGCITANPYTRGGAHDACRWCPYSTICHVADVEGRRNYKAISATEFWDAVGKEVNGNG